MDSNPLDALIAEGAALVDGTVVGTNQDWIALAKRQHAALKAGNKVCREHRASVVASTIRSAMSTAAEVPHGK